MIANHVPFPVYFCHTYGKPSLPQILSIFVFEIKASNDIRIISTKTTTGKMIEMQLAHSVAWKMLFPGIQNVVHAFGHTSSRNGLDGW